MCVCVVLYLALLYFTYNLYSTENQYSVTEWDPLLKITITFTITTELFTYYPKSKVTIIILHIILLCVHSLKLSCVKLPPYHVT